RRCWETAKAFPRDRRHKSERQWTRLERAESCAEDRRCLAMLDAVQSILAIKNLSRYKESGRKHRRRLRTEHRFMVGDGCHGNEQDRCGNKDNNDDEIIFSEHY